MKKTASLLLRSCFDLLLWCLCFLAVFGSCHRPVETVHEPSPDPALVSIDSLMWESPDSAFAEYLKSVEVMENRFDEADLTGQKAKFMALNYSHF